jgi:hypothetical protein
VGTDSLMSVLIRVEEISEQPRAGYAKR